MERTSLARVFSNKLKHVLISKSLRNKKNVQVFGDQPLSLDWPWPFNALQGGHVACEHVFRFN